MTSSSTWRPLCLLITVLVLSSSGCADLPIHFQSPVVVSRVWDASDITATDIRGRDQLVYRNTDLAISGADDRHLAKISVHWLKEEERYRLTTDVKGKRLFDSNVQSLSQAQRHYSGQDNNSVKLPTTLREIEGVRVTVFDPAGVEVIRNGNELKASTIASVEDFLFNKQTGQLERLDRTSYWVSLTPWERIFGKVRAGDWARSLPPVFTGTWPAKTKKLLKKRFKVTP